jgi:hypothetical protein
VSSGAATFANDRRLDETHAQADAAMKFQLTWRIVVARPFNHSMSSTDRITYVKWMCGVAALYASIVLVIVIGHIVSHRRSNHPETQTVSLQRLQSN